MEINFKPFIENIKESEFREFLDTAFENDKVEILLIKYLLKKISGEEKFGIITRNRSYYFYNGCYWEAMSDDILKRFLQDVAFKLNLPEVKSRDPKFIDKLSEALYLNALNPEETTKNDSIHINFLNGVLEIQQDHHCLLKHNKNLFLTYQLPFNYDPDAKYPRFNKYLNEVVPEKEKQLVLGEFFGSIFYQLKHEKALFLLGDGANGKSVLFEIMNALLGTNNITSYTLNNLTNSTGIYRSQIENKLLNYTSEIDGRFNHAIFKQLVSGERVEVRKLYKDPYHISNYARLAFNCNNLPREVEHNKAFFRRLLIVPFEITIDEKNQDKFLAKKIIESELSGILNWVIEGLERLRQNANFSYCESCETLVREYRTNTDNVQLFIEELQYTPGTQIKPLQSIYKEYSDYCSENGYRSLGKIKFKESLIKKGFEVTRRSEGMVIFIEIVEQKPILTSSNNMYSLVEEEAEQIEEYPF